MLMIRLSPSLLLSLLALSAALLWLGTPTLAFADTFTVTTTSDSGPGSLRQAILSANAHPNASAASTDRDVIAFAIPGCGQIGPVCTIAPTSALPTITESAILDARTQGGGPATPGRPWLR